jgi:hypothetical protein
MAALPYPQVEVIARIGTMDLLLEAWLDTGFEGGLMVPASLRHEILSPYDDAPFRLADGHQVRVPAWSGEVEIAGHPFPCEIIGLGKQVLIGLEVLNQFDVEFSRGTELRFRFPGGEEHTRQFR